MFNIFITYYEMINKVILFIHILFIAPAESSSAEEDQFIEMTSDSTLRLRLTAQTLSEFWVGVEREYPLIGQRAVLSCCLTENKIQVPAQH